LNPALLKYVMLVDVFPTVSRQHGGPIPKGFFFHRMEQNFYWENCTCRTVSILIFVTAKAVKGIGVRFSYQVLKKMCEVIFSQMTSRLDS
jgi:hypothetical protein